MEISGRLFQAIEKQIEGHQHDHLLKDAQNISLRYRENKGDGKKLLTRQSEAVAYALSRMPATYGAVTDALNYTFQLVDFAPESLLDVGAGTGAATWAAEDIFDLKTCTCLEREEAMISIGMAVMNEDEGLKNKTEWIQCDLVTDSIDLSADVVIASYVLNEMTEANRLKVVEKLWHSTNKILIVVGPGTPQGYKNLLRVRAFLIEKNAQLIAPCPSPDSCPASRIEGEWCHFSCRINRSKTHKRLKGGQAPFEDEKYIYFSFAKPQIEYKNANSRVLRHPMKRNGYVELVLCSDNQIIKQKLTKKDKEYKQARKIKSGDGFNMFK